MAISIRNSECERLARYLSDRNGSGMTEEILSALRDRVKKTDTGFSRKERIEKISAECAALPDLDTREPDEILGYDENGGFSHGD
jgi:antitoxin VapB